MAYNASLLKQYKFKQNLSSHLFIEIEKIMYKNDVFFYINSLQITKTVNIKKIYHQIIGIDCQFPDLSLQCL